MFTDELEFNDIGAYGGNFPTPELDKLAGEGIRFNRAYCPASMCTPARFAFLTGLAWEIETGSVTGDPRRRCQRPSWPNHGRLARSLRPECDRLPAREMARFSRPARRVARSGLRAA